MAETGNTLSEELNKIDNLVLSASVQKKKGRLYVVISYKKPIWRATGLKDAPGNKKIAKNKINTIINEFKEELKEETVKKYEEINKKQTIPLDAKQLENEYQNEPIYSNENLDEIRLNKYREMSFIAFIKESLEEFKPNVAPTTYEAWFSCFSSRMSDYFRIIPINERGSMMDPNIERPIYYKEVPKLINITQFDIEDYMKWLYDCKLKGATVDKHYELFKLVFARAVRKKIITREFNPMLDIPKPHVEQYIADYYRPSELKTLFDIVRGDIIEVPILIAGTYGLRRSEILGIKWNAIDFEANTLVIKHTVTKVVGNKENQIIESRDLTKSRYGYRTYPLTPEIRKILLKKKMQIEMNKMIYKDTYVNITKDYVCVKEDGELIKPDHLTKRFQKLAQENDLRKIRLHDIRHSVGSLLAANNVNLRQIQDFLGHGSIKSTERYSHLQYETKQNSIGIIEKIYTAR